VIAAMHPRKWYEMEHHFFRALGHGSEDSKLSELEGPNPRRGAEYQPEALVPALTRYLHPHGRLVYPNDGRRSPTISERQWLLWREHDALAVPMWVVQGHEGGHPLQWTRLEIAMNQVMATGKTRPPAVGELPYATGDRRVIERLMEWQEVQRLTKEVREDWFAAPEETWSPSERRLHQLFQTWYDDGLENRLDTSSRDHARFA
jgi:hypothetical protein